MADLESWPEHARATVQRTFLALWGLWLAGGSSPGGRKAFEDAAGGPGQLLDGCAIVGIDPSPLVDALAERALTDKELAFAILWLSRSVGETVDGDQWRLEEVVRAFLREAVITRLRALALQTADEWDWQHIITDLERARTHAAPR